MFIFAFLSAFFLSRQALHLFGSLLNPFSKRRYYFKKQKHAPPRNQFDKEPNRYPMPDDYITMSNMQLDPNELMLVLCITSDKKV